MNPLHEDITKDGMGYSIREHLRYLHERMDALFEPREIPPLEPTCPPLEPTWYRENSTTWPSQLHNFNAEVIHQEVVFKMSALEYAERMYHEERRLEREKQQEKLQRDRAEVMMKQQQTINQLMTMQVPTVAALRQAYAEDKITQEEFERLVLHCIAGEE